jgi:hypothetical protein
MGNDPSAPEVDGDVHAAGGPEDLDPSPAAEADESGVLRDRFYHGVIVQVHWGRGTGVVRSGNGREIPFEFPFVTMIGARRSIEHLHPGMRVGFDVGWTSRGLRVTSLKLYD